MTDLCANLYADPRGRTPKHKYEPGEVVNRWRVVRCVGWVSYVVECTGGFDGCQGRSVREERMLSVHRQCKVCSTADRALSKAIAREGDTSGGFELVKYLRREVCKGKPESVYVVRCLRCDRRFEETAHYTVSRKDCGCGRAERAARRKRRVEATWERLRLERGRVSGAVEMRAPEDFRDGQITNLNVPFERDPAAADWVDSREPGQIATLDEVAIALGVSRERVRQIEEEAMARVRRLKDAITALCDAYPGESPETIGEWIGAPGWFVEAYRDFDLDALTEAPRLSRLAWCGGFAA